MIAMPDSLPVPIIRSKLYPPPVAPDTVTRERLMALAPAIAGTSATLISAPAGFGKSTLASHWLRNFNGKSAWVSLDPADGDLLVFVSYVVAALRLITPGCCGRTARYLAASSLPSADELAGVFSNDFEAIRASVILTLDDFQNIAASAVHDFLDTLLKRPPKGLHIVIISRRDPPLCIHELRARGTLTEVRMQHLAFDSNEAAEFVGRKLGEGIAPQAIAKLHESTEGWAVGLRLATLAIGQPDRSDDIVNHLPVNTHVLQDYLLREVLAMCPESMRELLFRTAFLKRFCAPLCDAMADDDKGSKPVSGSEFMRWINAVGLFTIALDGENAWYRYHHLFQSMLLQEAKSHLEADVIRSLHLRAATWFEKAGLLQEAIEHLLAVGAGIDAGRIIARQTEKILENEQWHLLETLLNMLPDGVADHNPELLLLMALSEDNRGLFEDSWKTLDRLDELLGTKQSDRSDDTELRGSIEALRAFQYYVHSDGEKAMGSARRALQLLPQRSGLQRGSALMMLAGAMQLTGKGSEVPGIVLGMSANTSGLPQIRSIAGLAFSQWMDGDLGDLVSTARLLSRCARDTGLPESRDAAAYFSAIIAYERNELADVTKLLGETVESNAVMNGELFVQCQCLAALAYFELDERSRAADCVKAIERFSQRLNSHEIMSLARALAAELAFRNGRTAEASSWARKTKIGVLTPHYNFFQESMTRAKVLVAGNDDMAERVLEDLVHYMERTHNARFLAETLALRALVQEQGGRAELADRDLARAVAIAQPGRFIRLFVDLGPRLVPVLNRLDADEETLAYIGEILAAYRKSSIRDENDPAVASTGTRQTLIEPLSRRELQVLALLAERLSNQEIADKLHISTVTVKRHAANIYQKLAVHGRRQAVAKAAGLGMLGPTSKA